VTDDLAYADVYTALASAEQTLGRTINPTVFTRAQGSVRGTTHSPPKSQPNGGFL